MPLKALIETVVPNTTANYFELIKRQKVRSQTYIRPEIGVDPGQNRLARTFKRKKPYWRYRCIIAEPDDTTLTNAFNKERYDYSVMVSSCNLCCFTRPNLRALYSLI
jgi:hypothetical protein